VIELVGVLMIFSDSDDLTIFINYNNTLAAFHAAVVIHRSGRCRSSMSILISSFQFVNMSSVFIEILK